jgi:hypothetical protein
MRDRRAETVIYVDKARQEIRGREIMRDRRADRVIKIRRDSRSEGERRGETVDQRERDKARQKIRGREIMRDRRAERVIQIRRDRR